MPLYNPSRKPEQGVIICDNCGKTKDAHRERGCLRICFPDTFPHDSPVFKPKPEQPTQCIHGVSRYEKCERCASYGVEPIPCEWYQPEADALFDSQDAKIAELELGNFALTREAAGLKQVTIELEKELKDTRRALDLACVSRGLHLVDVYLEAARNETE